MALLMEPTSDPAVPSTVLTASEATGTLLASCATLSAGAARAPVRRPVTAKTEKAFIVKWIRVWVKRMTRSWSYSKKQKRMAEVGELSSEFAMSKVKGPD